MSNTLSITVEWETILTEVPAYITATAECTDGTYALNFKSPNTETEIVETSGVCILEIEGASSHVEIEGSDCSGLVDVREQSQTCSYVATTFNVGIPAYDTMGLVVMGAVILAFGLWKLRP